MEKYEAILKTINDKIANSEKLIEYLREENEKKDAIIRKLEAKNIELIKKIDNLTF